MERYLKGDCDFEFNYHSDESVYLQLYTNDIKNIQYINNVLDSPEITNKISKVKGLQLYLSNDKYPDYDYPEIPHEFKAQLSIPQIIIPDNIKYLNLDCESRYYTNMHLPHNLEYLKIYTMVSQVCEGILEYIKLPSTVKSLCITMTNDSQSDSDTLSLDEKSVNEAINNLNAFIPLHIEYLSINFEIKDFQKYQSLNTLIIQDNEDYIPKSLKNLPTSLEWLDIRSNDFNQPLNNLPPNLKFLRFAQNRVFNYNYPYQHQLNMLPFSLEVLFFPENIKYDDPDENVQITMDNLPPNLKILNIPEYMSKKTNFNNLPDSIEILEWKKFSKYFENIIHFPNKLREIKVFENNLEIMKEIYKDEPFIITKL